MSGTRFLVTRDSSQRGRGLSNSRLVQPGRWPGIAVSQVLFDLAGILYDDSAWRRWLLHRVVHMGLHTHYHAFFRAWDREFQAEVWSGKREFWAALRQFLVAAGLSAGQADEIAAGCRARFRQFEQDLRPFPSVAETLQRITALGSTATVVSQAPLSAEEIRQRLAKLGLLDHVHQLSYSAMDLRHPHDFFSRFAQQRCGIPQEAAYVGRDPARLAEAREAHLQTVAFNQEAGVQADYYIEQLDQVLDVLELDGHPMRAAG